MNIFQIKLMNMKIKIKVLTEGCMPEIIEKGDWIDLKVAKNVKLEANTSKVNLLPLGVAMKLPEGFEAIVAARSSTPSKLGIICANALGIIDNSFMGNEDEWKFPAIAIKDATIKKGTRICQFRIQLSQKATIWQKIKWLFSNKIELVQVDNLSDNNRGGIGSTGD